MTRITVHRDQALAFNPRWDESDRKQLAAFLDGDGSVLSYKDEVEHRREEIDAVVATLPGLLDHMYRTASSGDVKGVDAKGRKLFAIRPGAIDLWMGVDACILHFTTVGWWGPRARSSDPSEVPTCPIHHVQLPKTGVCDLCE
ncbi:hypothetical protein [Intrasporangium calvum]|uniref:hypothetical protein n=1 Tax=Intrasporangium calvum TaxID=53358 RepID=UPI000DF637E6|nr:hypothetical protein [Intrasporangium calvum]AXG14961.1 hypothetical protein DN585_17495 [Intrasporangium calvum]